MPRKKVLLRKYLEEGISISGDVFYPEDTTCYGACAQYGTVTYGDPRGGRHKHHYIRRSVRLFENFSREWVAILVLPDRPYSGQPKSDMEMAYLATEREKTALNFLASYTAVWMVGSFAAAIYVLSVIRSNKYEDEFPDGWMWLFISLALIPILAVAVNFLIFQRHMRWMTKGDARILEKGEKEGGENGGGEAAAVAAAEAGTSTTTTTEYKQIKDDVQPHLA
ncbi:hypothetical protein ACA910_004921 [Epithemia clementina (nom. ined.)]